MTCMHSSRRSRSSTCQAEYAKDAYLLILPGVLGAMVMDFGKPDRFVRMWLMILGLRVAVLLLMLGTRRPAHYHCRIRLSRVV